VLDAAWLWRMWLELSTCRDFGAGVPGPIPITASWAYVDRYGLPEWTVDAMVTLDAAWREAEARRPANEGEKSNLPQPARGMIRHGNDR
jgi:hypothetical protein